MTSIQFDNYIDIELKTDYPVIQQKLSIQNYAGLKYGYMKILEGRKFIVRWYTIKA